MKAWDFFSLSSVLFLPTPAVALGQSGKLLQTPWTYQSVLTNLSNSSCTRSWPILQAPVDMHNPSCPFLRKVWPVLPAPTFLIICSRPRCFLTNLVGSVCQNRPVNHCDLNRHKARWMNESRKRITQSGKQHVLPRVSESCQFLIWPPAAVVMEAKTTSVPALFLLGATGHAGSQSRYTFTLNFSFSI